MRARAEYFQDIPLKEWGFDNNGDITADELHAGFDRNGLPNSPETGVNGLDRKTLCTQVYAVFDTDGNGQVQRHEWRRMVEPQA